MMLYEIKYDGGQKMVRASSDEEALARFRASWEEYGGEAPCCWIVARWALEVG